jgi:hypothetical protein
MDSHITAKTGVQLEGNNARTVINGTIMQSWVDQTKWHEIVTGNNNSDSYSDSEFCIGAVDSSSNGLVFVDLQVVFKGHFKQFKLDTRTCCNIFLEADFKSLKVNIPLKKQTGKLTANSGTGIKVLGVKDLSCSYKKKCTKLVENYVVRKNKPSILGLQSCLDFN